MILHRIQPLPARRGGFTIVELMVVLAIGTIVAAITVGGFKSVSENNRKTSCQANLAQIYLASKQYAQDFDGRFPYLNGGAAVNYNDADSPQGGFGLWTLYAFAPSGGDQNCEATINNTNDPLPEPEANSRRLTGYARALKIFHCPSDKFSEDVKYSTDNCTSAAKTLNLTSGEPIFTVDEGAATERKFINPLFMSYQGQDDIGNTPIYSVFRAPYQATVDTTVRNETGRQLQPFRVDGTATNLVRRAPDTTTVITWCRFHRSRKSRTETNDNKRNYDNVLFYDGSIQFLPTRMNLPDGSSTNTGGNTGWQRLPRATTR